MPLREITSTNNDQYVRYNDLVITDKYLDRFTGNIGGKANFNYLSIGY